MLAVCCYHIIIVSVRSLSLFPSSSVVVAVGSLLLFLLVVVTLVFACFLVGLFVCFFVRSFVCSFVCCPCRRRRRRRRCYGCRFCYSCLLFTADWLNPERAGCTSSVTRPVG